MMGSHSGNSLVRDADKGGITMATDTEKIVKDFIEVFNLGDADKAASFFTDDCVYEDMAVGEVFPVNSPSLLSFVGLRILENPPLQGNYPGASRL